jgi:alanine-synthesizing transaminase
MAELELFRIDHLPPYPLGSIAQAVTDARLQGVDVIDLSQVNPNLGAPGIGVDKLVQASLLAHNHRYSSSQGITKLRQGACRLYRERRDVDIDLDEEVVVTCGIKEGLSHLLLALCAPGESVVIPTPSYPVHAAGVSIAGASVLGIPLFQGWEEAERLEHLFETTWPRPRVMVLNFPHNPTTTTVDRSFFERLVELARRRGVYLIHDFAYAEICFDGYRAPSILEVAGAKEVAVEFYSLSKGFNTPGWRIAFGLGNRKLITALKRIKSYLDFGTFQPLQIAAVEVMNQAEAITEEVRRTYEMRRDLVVEGLEQLGWRLHRPRATVFLWAELPESVRSALIPGASFSHALLESCGVAVCPGAGFDPHARSHIRLALVEPEHRLRSAVEKIGGLV